MIHAAWIHFYGNIFIIFKFLQLSIFSKEFLIWQFFRLRLRFQTQGRSRSFIGGSSLIHWIIDSDVDDHLNYFGRENNSYRHQVAVDLAQTFSAGSVVVSVSFMGLIIFAVERYRANELLELYSFTDEKRLKPFLTRKWIKIWHWNS